MYSISVIVPVYNVEKYLEKCVRSILDQTVKVNEIILVDDGSKDNSGILADELARSFSHIKVVHKINGGLSSARNAGLDIATGEYVSFIDSDDYIDPDFYEILLKNIKSADADMAICGVWYEQESGPKYTPYPNGKELLWNKIEGLIELNSYRYFNMSFCDAVFRRSLFEMEGYGEGKLRFPEGKTCEDYYLMHRVVARTERITYTSKPMYHYVQRENSISRNDKINTAQLDASLSQLAFYRKWFPQLSYVAETACAFSHMGIYSGYVRKQMNCPKELINELKKLCKKWLPSVLKNKYIPNIKKLQALSFCYCIPLYKSVIARTSHR